MNVKLSSRCFKIDSANAKAMIDGFEKDGENIHQCIYCMVRSKDFPRLITLDKRPTKFQLSFIGRQLRADHYQIPYKYVADQVEEYYIDWNSDIWEIICNNGLFDIWRPEAPRTRFANSKTPEDKFRLVLLRIYEMDDEYDESDIVSLNARNQKIVSGNLFVNLKRPIISDEEFREVKNKLEDSIRPYQR